MNTQQKESKTKHDFLKKQYGKLLASCISVESKNTSDSRYKLNQLNQQLGKIGLRVTIKIGIEKIDK
jgi:hypothetical protein